MDKLGQEPAFAHACANDQSHSIEFGMSKRFYAACGAMQGILSTKSEYMLGNCDVPVPREIAKYAFECADELLKLEYEQ